MGNVKTNEGWVCQHDYDGDFVIFDKGRIVAVTDSDTEWDARNANRIAAAPEMYELAKMIDFFGDALIAKEWEPGSFTISKLVEAARNALAKAEGRA